MRKKLELVTHEFQGKCSEPRPDAMEPLNIRWDPKNPTVFLFDDGSMIVGPKLKIEEDPLTGEREAVQYYTSKRGGLSALFARTMARWNEQDNGVRH